ncbi:hypothetical protein, partial [Klebsiella pneumoniae]
MITILRRYTIALLSSSLLLSIRLGAQPPFIV